MFYTFGEPESEALEVLSGPLLHLVLVMLKGERSVLVNVARETSTRKIRFSLEDTCAGNMSPGSSIMSDGETGDLESPHYLRHVYLSTISLKGEYTIHTAVSLLLPS